MENIFTILWSFGVLYLIVWSFYVILWKDKMNKHKRLDDNKDPLDYKIDKGNEGEKEVAKILEKLPKEEYQVINNIMLLLDDGKTCQIDHMVISPYGIFVIETKNFSGLVTGNEDSPQWTESFYSFRKSKANKYHFENPLIQNTNHIKALNKSTGIDEKYFIPIVTFSREAKVQVYSKKPVVYYEQLLNEIRTNHDKKIFTDELVRDLVFFISSKNVSSREMEEKHVEEIRKTEEEIENKIKEGICPWCNNKLRLINGRYGNFYGCTNYPYCRYTHKV